MVLFLTCLLDIIGLTLVIPLLPYLLDFYLTIPEGVDPTWLQQFAQWFIEVSDAFGMSGLGGALAMSGLFALLYSFCQFIGAPIWGRLSDRYGRKAILSWTVAGTILAHLIWVFGASLEWFLLMRVLAGLMAGSISVATAAIADVTPAEKRARAMTTIGLAYGIGYMAGPLLGGLSAEYNLLEVSPDLAAFGMHPFSMTALVAVGMTVINLIVVILVLPETLPPHRRDPSVGVDASLLSSLLEKPPRRELSRIFNANLFFFLIFTGCEFNLVFLAFQRFAFSALQNSMMYLLIGGTQIVAQFILLPHILKVLDERQVSVAGFGGLMTGVLLCAFAWEPWVLYTGCGVMSFGASIVSPVSRRWCHGLPR